jgi:hypothetical protein
MRDGSTDAAQKGTPTHAAQLIPHSARSVMDCDASAPQSTTRLDASALHTPFRFHRAATQSSPRAHKKTLAAFSAARV